MVTEHLCVGEVETIKEIFALMDTGNHTRITLQELKAGLTSVGLELTEPDMELPISLLCHIAWYICCTG